jgi:hypothetical protein
MRFYEFNTLINEDVGHIFLKFREQKAGPSGEILQAYWGSAGTARELKYQGNQFRGIYSSKDLINLVSGLANQYDKVIVDAAGPLVSKYKDVFSPLKQQVDAGTYGDKVRVDLRGFYTDKMRQSKMQTVREPVATAPKAKEVANIAPDWDRLISKKDGLVRFRLGPKILYDAIWQSGNDYLNNFIKRYEFDEGERKQNFFQMSQEDFKNFYNKLTSLNFLMQMQQAVNEYTKTNHKINVYPRFIPAPNQEMLPEVEEI